jgi:putative peptidoglycan lipid II flippase
MPEANSTSSMSTPARTADDGAVGGILRPMQRTPDAEQRRTIEHVGRPTPDPPPITSATARRLYSAVGSVALAFVFGRLLGFLRDILIARQFGTGPTMDAYTAAFRIPDLIFSVVMAGAFGSAFVPVFAGFLAQGQPRKAWQLSSNVLTLMVEGYAAFALIVFLFADPLVRYVIAPGFDEPTKATTVELTRILLLSPLLLGLGAAAKSVLEAHDRFTLPAYAPVVYNVAGVFGALVLAPRFDIKGLVWGIVLGSLGHVLVQLPGLSAVRMRYIIMPRPVAEGVKTVGRLLGPRIIGQAAFQINFFLILTTFASQLGPGIPSALNYGFQLMQLPHGLLAISVSTVIFPLLSRLFVNQQFAELKTTLGDALRPLFFLTLPASVALAILARPIVQLLYQRGNFGADSTALVAGTVPFFAAGLVALAIVETSARAFYAMQDTRTPLFASLAAIGVNLILAYALSRRFGAPGLAVSMSATATIEMAALLIGLRRRIGPFDAAVWTALLKSLLATAIMAILLLLLRDRLTLATDPAVSSGNAPMRFAFFGLALFLGLYTYLVAAWYLRTRELLELTDRFGGRFRRALRRGR